MKKSQTLRVDLSTHSTEALIRMLEKVNTDFTSGKVSRGQLVSWILVAFESQLERHVDRIRNDHFDQVAHLKNVLQSLLRAKRAGEALPELSELLKTARSTVRPDKIKESTDSGKSVP